jgi:hypothetical protein
VAITCGEKKPHIYNQPGFWKTSGSMLRKIFRIFVEYLRQFFETWLVVTGTLEFCGVTKLPKWLFYGIQWLVGGLEHEWIIFPFSWEFHHPN